MDINVGTKCEGSYGNGWGWDDAKCMGTDGDGIELSGNGWRWIKN
jgi:hypothetical protein